MGKIFEIVYKKNMVILRLQQFKNYEFFKNTSSAKIIHIYDRNGENIGKFSSFLVGGTFHKYFFFLSE